MSIQYYISAGMFVLFAGLVLGRAAILRASGVRVIVFGETDKSDFLLVPFVGLIVYAAAANAFGLPMWRPLIAAFWKSDFLGWAGVALCANALVGLAISLVGMGASFRVGIDEKKPDKLIKTGIYALSRNPIYVCFNMFFAGQFMIHRNLLIAVSAVCFALTIHRQILREEKFLQAHYGAEYEAYRKKVGRYL